MVENCKAINAYLEIDGAENKFPKPRNQKASELTHSVTPQQLKQK